MATEQTSQINYEMIIAAIAVVVSVISVLLTFWTIKIQQKHNRLSVRPIAEIRFSAVDGLSVDLVNVGVGPLICKQLLTNNNVGETKPHIADFIPDAIPFAAEVFTNRWDFTVLAGEKVNLILISPTRESNSQQSIKTIREAISTLSINVTYQDIYGETMPKYSKSLEWFGKLQGA